MSAAPDNQQIYAENWAEWTDMKVHGPASRWLRAMIGDALDRLPAGTEPGSILDVGCGEGTITHELAKRFPRARVMGVDFSAAGIACARERYARENLSFRHDVSSDALRETFDLVCAFEVLEHLEDWHSLLERMAGAARRLVFLSFPTGRMRDFEKTVGHFRNFAKGEIEHFLAGLGFRPQRVSYAGFPFYSPIYREICNLTNAAGSSFTRGRYGWRQRAAAQVFYFAFRWLSTRRRGGDQFCGLFARTPEDSRRP